MNEMQKLAEWLETAPAYNEFDLGRCKLMRYGKVHEPDISVLLLSEKHRGMLIAALRAQAQGEPVAADAGAVAERGLLAGTYPLPIEHYERKARNLANLWADGSGGAFTCILTALLEAATPTAAGIAAPPVVRAPASCPNCFDATDCANVDVCNAVEQVYAAPPAASADAVREAQPSREAMAREIDPKAWGRRGEFFAMIDRLERAIVSGELIGSVVGELEDYPQVIASYRLKADGVVASSFRAADRIAALTAPVAGADAGMRAALEFAANDCYLDDVDGYQPTEVAKRARAALGLSASGEGDAAPLYGQEEHSDGAGPRPVPMGKARFGNDRFQP